MSADLLPTGPLREFLSRLPFTSVEISERTGVHQQTIQNILSRRTGSAAIRTIDRILIAFDRHPIEFYPDEY